MADNDKHESAVNQKKIFRPLGYANKPQTTSKLNHLHSNRTSQCCNKYKIATT